jgi:hypothetical protein
MESGFIIGIHLNLEKKRKNKDLNILPPIYLLSPHLTHPINRYLDFRPCRRIVVVMRVPLNQDEFSGCEKSQK